MAARRPNVLIVLMDQLQRGAPGAHGIGLQRTGRNRLFTPEPPRCSL